jgi:putative endonuclease
MPFIMIYSEKFETRNDARTKERYLKSGIGKEFLKKFK